MICLTNIHVMLKWRDLLIQATRNWERKILALEGINHLFEETFHAQGNQREAIRGMGDDVEVSCNRMI